MTERSEGDILTSSLAVKVSAPARMSSRLLIGQEGDTLVGSLAVKENELSE